MTQSLDLRGRTILITGCNSGLGAELARVLALRGARIVGLGRTIERARAGCEGLPDAVPIACDLAEPTSVLAAASAIRGLQEPLHAIVANAGIMSLPKLELAHGFERQFFTNHVGHHLLVTRSLDTLAPDGRVVMLSSSLHAAAPREGIQFENLDGHKGYSPQKAYGQSKLANILFARHLSERLAHPRQTANAVHPGVVRTGLQRFLGAGSRMVFAAASPFFKSVQQGAATPAFVAAHPAAAGVNGAYFVDCAPATPSAEAVNADLAARLWEETERILRAVQ